MGDDIEKNRICIDANMMTNAILFPEFKIVLIQNIGKDFPYTTEVCKKETIGNIRSELKISQEEAEKRFKEFREELSLEFLNFKEEYQKEADKLFTKVISSGMKIKNPLTFLKDCTNIIIILKNNIEVFFCNDEELAKVCKKFKVRIEFIKIPTSDEKIIKDWRKKYSKLRY